MRFKFVYSHNWLDLLEWGARFWVLHSIHPGLNTEILTLEQNNLENLLGNVLLHPVDLPC
ncbi:MAG: hypothetical protein ACE5HS_18110 [bacterium]